MHDNTEKHSLNQEVLIKGTQTISQREWNLISTTPFPTHIIFGITKPQVGIQQRHQLLTFGCVRYRTIGVQRVRQLLPKSGQRSFGLTERLLKLLPARELRRVGQEFLQRCLSAVVVGRGRCDGEEEWNDACVKQTIQGPLPTEL